MPTIDAISVLKNDHRAVEVLFKKFETSSDRALKTRQALVGKMIRELVTHTHVEETVFYPFVRELGSTLNAEVLEALEEHHAAKTTLAELQNMSASDERFAPKTAVLIESVRHHVREEERQLFPAVRKAVARTELIDLVPAMTDARRSAPSRAHPAAPDTPPGADLAAIASKSLDVLKDRAGDVRDVVGSTAGKVVRRVHR